MKSYVSEQIKNKQEQAAYIKQLERNLEENKIEDNAVHNNDGDSVEIVLLKRLLKVEKRILTTSH